MSGWVAVGGTDFRLFFCGPGPEGLRGPGRVALSLGSAQKPAQGSEFLICACGMV